MAVITTVMCVVCGQTKRECRNAGDYSNICGECEGLERTKKEREWIAGREGLTIEERLRALESFMYNHGEHYRGPMRF